MKKYLIAPSILSANFACLGEEINKVVLAGADIIHFDVMDNHYVPNISIGPMVLKSLRDYGITIPIDVHLMVKPVEQAIIDFAISGADFITFHPEATNHIDGCLRLIKKQGCKAGLAINPALPLNCLEYVLSNLDLILIMGVNPGFGGQKFLPFIVDKICKTRTIIDNSGHNIYLEVDGGIKLNNINVIANAGADIFVIGSGIFTKPNYKMAINDMRIKLSTI